MADVVLAPKEVIAIDTGTGHVVQGSGKIHDTSLPTLMHLVKSTGSDTWKQSAATDAVVTTLNHGSGFWIALRSGTMHMGHLLIAVFVDNDRSAEVPLYLASLELIHEWHLSRTRLRSLGGGLFGTLNVTVRKGQPYLRMRDTGESPEGKSKIAFTEKVIVSDGQATVRGRIVTAGLFQIVRLRLNDQRAVIDAIPGDWTAEDNGAVFVWDRAHADGHLWNPMLMRYTSSAFVRLVLLSVTSAEIRVRGNLPAGLSASDLIVAVHFRPTTTRPRFTLSPQNLSHLASFDQEDRLVWRIEGVCECAEYSLRLADGTGQVVRATASYRANGILASGLFVTEYSLDDDPARNVAIVYETQVEETLEMAALPGLDKC